MPYKIESLTLEMSKLNSVLKNSSSGENSTLATLFATLRLAEDASSRSNGSIDCDSTKGDQLTTTNPCKTVTWSNSYTKRPSISRSFSLGSIDDNGQDAVENKASYLSPSIESVQNAKSSGPKKKRSFGQPIVKTLSFLRRRQIDSNFTRLSMRSQVYNKRLEEDIRSWSTSFDNLLSSGCGLKAFRAFLQLEFSDENIEFWLECQNFRSIPDYGDRCSYGRRIFTQFVDFQAPREINLDSTTRNITISLIAKDSGNLSIFDAANHRIRFLMEKDSYPRFLRSDIYTDLLRRFNRTDS